MPTTFTEDLYKGKEVSFKDFVAKAARGMMMFIHMREAAWDAPLRYPAAPTNSYYHKSLREAQVKATVWSHTSEEDKYALWSEFYERYKDEQAKTVEKKAALRERYDGMREQVVAKDVPEAMESFKQFMLSQLDMCIEAEATIRDWDISDPTDYVTWCEQRDDPRLGVEYYEKEIRREWENYHAQVADIDLFAKTFGIEVVK